MADEYDPSLDPRQFVFAQQDDLGRFGATVGQWPTANVTVQPEPTGDRTREIFDTLWAAGAQARKVAHQKAVDAEAERVRTEWMLSRTASQLKALDTVQKMETAKRQQQAQAAAAEMISRGVDPRKALLSSLGPFMTPAQMLSATKEGTPGTTWSEPFKMSLGGKERDVQTNQAGSIKVLGTAPPQEKQATIRELQSKRDVIDQALSTLPRESGWGMRKLADIVPGGQTSSTMQDQNAQLAQKRAELEAQRKNIDQQLLQLATGRVGTVAPVEMTNPQDAVTRYVFKDGKFVRAQ